MKTAISILVASACLLWWKASYAEGGPEDDCISLNEIRFGHHRIMRRGIKLEWHDGTVEFIAIYWDGGADEFSSMNETGEMCRQRELSAWEFHTIMDALRIHDDQERSKDMELPRQGVTERET